MTFVIKKAKIPAWGYEITAKGFHNIAPSVESAINYLKARYGSSVKYTVKGEEVKHKKELGFEWLREKSNEHYEAKEQLRHILGERETEMLYQLTTTERRYMEWN